MQNSKEIFAEIKRQALTGRVEIVFAETFDDLHLNGELTQNLKLTINDSGILLDTDAKIRIKGKSKEFIFKNLSVDIEVEFNLIGEELQINSILKIVDAPKKLSDFPGVMGEYLGPLNSLKIENLAFLISSVDTTVLDSAEFPEFQNNNFKINKGICLSGNIDLEKCGDVAKLLLEPLESVIGKGPYFMTCDLGGGELEKMNFSLALPDDFKIANFIQLRKPTIKLKPIKPFQLSINGEFDLQLPGLSNDIPLIGAFKFRPNSIEGEIVLDSIVEKIPSPFLEYPGIHFSALSVSAGLTNAIGNFGASGSFYVGSEKPDITTSKNKKFGNYSTNEFKFKFDTIPGKLIPKFAFLYLNKLTIGEYLKAQTNKELNLPAFLDGIALEQLMFHWCENSLGEEKPDGTIAMPLFGVSGISNLFGYKTFLELNVDISEEWKGNFITDPINIGNGLLKITGNGKGTPQKYKGINVNAGGMEMRFSTTGNPEYFYVSAQIEVLGLKGAGEGSITKDGFYAKVSVEISNIINDQLELIWNKKTFIANANINTKISDINLSIEKLGQITINSSLEGSFKGEFKNNKFSNSFNLSFDFLGVKFEIGDISKYVIVEDLNDIVKQLEEFIKDVVIKKLVADVLVWLKGIYEGIITFIGDQSEEIARGLVEHFNKTIDESVKLMKETGYVAEQIGQTLLNGFKSTAEQTAEFLKQGEFIAQDVAKTLTTVFALGQDQVAVILKNVGYPVEQVGVALKNIFNLEADVVNNILTNVGFPKQAIDDVTKTLFPTITVGGIPIPIPIPPIPIPACCYLTSSSIINAGLDLNSYQYKTVHKFGEDYFANHPFAKRLIAEYIKKAPKIIEYYDKQSNKAELYEEMYRILIVPTLKLLEENKREEAFEYYKNYVQTKFEKIKKKYYGKRNY